MPPIVLDRVARFASIGLALPNLFLTPLLIDIMIEVNFSTRLLNHLIVIHLFFIWLFCLSVLTFNAFPVIACMGVAWVDVYSCRFWSSGLLVQLIRLFCEQNTLNITATCLFNTLWPAVDLMHYNAFRFIFGCSSIMFAIITTIPVASYTQIAPHYPNCCTHIDKASLVESDPAFASQLIVSTVAASLPTLLVAVISIVHLGFYATVRMSRRLRNKPRFEPLTEFPVKYQFDLFMSAITLLYSGVDFIRLTELTCILRSNRRCAKMLQLTDTLLTTTVICCAPLTWALSISVVRDQAKVWLANKHKQLGAWFGGSSQGTERSAGEKPTSRG